MECILFCIGLFIGFVCKRLFGVAPALFSIAAFAALMTAVWLEIHHLGLASSESVYTFFGYLLITFAGCCLGRMCEELDMQSIRE